MSEAPVRPRGRPRQFDEDTVLDELTSLFWRKGYTQTSVADLVDASGMHKPSLYRVFGTKEELFSKVLRRYMSARMEMFAALVDEAGSGIDGIHAFLSMIRDDVVSGTSRHGCLLVATATELGGTTPGFENFGPLYRNEVRGVMRELVAKAGGTAAVIDQRTDMIVTWFFGLDVSVRGGADEAEIDRMIDAMHATVDTWHR
jgi:AcrR family transcriptional regulator